MILLLSLPIILSSLLLAAHFYRAEITILALLSFIIPLSLLIKHHLVPRFVVFTLLMGTAEWLRTMFLLIIRYQEMGYSWTRLALILSAVALFTALSCLVFRTPTMKRRYSAMSNESITQSEDR